MDQDKSSTFSYSTINFITDELRGTFTPVGVALWGRHPGSVRLRVLRENETLRGINSVARAYIQAVVSQIQGWIEQGELPYSQRSLKPNSDSWWRHLSGLLVHKVRISQPLPIAYTNDEHELDLLFDAVVGPERRDQEKRERIDRIVGSSLGHLSRRFSKGELPGFEGRPVPVMRFAEDSKTLVILEGVNLAASRADYDTDALVSRIQRIRKANGASERRDVVAVVGYLASPNGLNGEAALVNWIRTAAGAETFDLIRDRDRFIGQLEEKIADIVLTQEGAHTRRSKSTSQRRHL